jgi:hypothetical protein
MTNPIILLHEEALRITHPIFKVVPEGTKTIYIWDDSHFARANFSLKRLIFIYETLCELPIEIIQGQTLSVVRELAPSSLIVPATNNPLIASTIETLKAIVSVQIVSDKEFSVTKNTSNFQSFFQYWKKVEKSAFLHDGGEVA